MVWTREKVVERLEEAALTLRRLPDPPGSGSRGFGSSWPDYVREAWHAYGYHAARVRIIPSAAEITRMEECLEWLAWLSAEDARLVWLRAEGARWERIGRKFGLSRSACWRRWVAAQVTIQRHLNKGKKPARRGPLLEERGSPPGSGLV